MPGLQPGIFVCKVYLWSPLLLSALKLMYTPAHFAMNVDEAIAFMQHYSFATIVTNVNCMPAATHLPFVIERREKDLVLVSHFAKANPQAHQITTERSLVIFSGPHAYISPVHYEKQQNVPTWNYIAVHAYGKATIISDPERVMSLLSHTINVYDAAYNEQWDNLPNDYKAKMANGIVAFEILVDDVQGKKKLSQNRSKTERQNIITDLSHSNDSDARTLSAYMNKGDA